MANRALPSNAWGDPAKILQEREDKTCAGCIFEVRRMKNGACWAICAKGNQHGNRCGLYEDRQG